MNDCISFEYKNGWVVRIFQKGSKLFSIDAWKSHDNSLHYRDLTAEDLHVHLKMIAEQGG